MPPFRHWMAVPALTGAAINAVGVLFGLLGVKSMLLEWQFWGLVAVSVVITLSAWQQAACSSFDAERTKVQAENNEKDSAEREKILQETVSELLNRITATNEQHQPKPAVEDLRHLSSAALRKEASKITARMRAMEQANHQAKNRVLYDEKLDQKQHTSKLIAQSYEQAHRWRSELQPEAVALWQEMLRRIYGAPPYPKDSRHRTIAIEEGMLAGVSPLNDAALVIEELARDMPG